jgi:hypothetical protein
MKRLITILIMSLMVGCAAPDVVQGNRLLASPTATPQTIQQLNQQPVQVRIGNGDVIIDNIGADHSSAEMRQMRAACRPGSNQYPCVTSDTKENACQIGTCLPAEIQGLPPKFNR